MLAAMRADVRRCGLYGLILNPAMWAVLGYRVRRAVMKAPRPVRWLLAPVTLPGQVLLQVLTQVQISTFADVGPGLLLPHSGTIVIGAGSKLGANCVVVHGVTVGHAGGRSGSTAAGPRIGDRVYLGPNAVVLGDITVGDDALVAAAAVVVKPVPPRGVVAGNPAKLLNTHGAFDLVSYPGMANDPARQASLAQREGK